MTKSLHLFAILAALLLSRAVAASAQQSAPAPPAAKPRIAPGTGPQQAEPPAEEPKAAEPEPKSAEPKAPEPRRAATLEEMLRGQRDDRWRRERDALRQSMEEAGLNDARVQDAVVDFAARQDASREKLRAAAARCWDGLRNPDLKDAELKALQKSYQDAAVEALAEREKGLADLDAKVHWKASPRLEMLLRLKGLLGSEAWMTGDALGEGESFDLRTLYPAAE